MGATVISGAGEPLGTQGTGTAGAALENGDPIAGSAPDILNTPDLPWSNPTYDTFNKAMMEGSTYPGGFHQTLQDGLNDTDSTSGGGNREALVKYAKKFLGVNYVWGGTSPSGFDCSGLVQYVTKKFGLNLPRISYQQANSGQREAVNKLQAGDLVAWDENNRNVGADHIAFYIGNGYILEAPHTGAQVRIRKLGKNEGAWGVHLQYPGDSK